jgi:hypothetical protein
MKQIGQFVSPVDPPAGTSPPVLCDYTFSRVNEAMQPTSLEEAVRRLHTLIIESCSQHGLGSDSLAVVPSTW